MNGQTQQKLINMGFIIFMVLACGSVFRIAIIADGISKEDGCALEHGENWSYEYAKHFGETCIEIDYISLEIIDRVGLNLTRGELNRKYCDFPSFWNLLEWHTRCRDE